MRGRLNRPHSMDKSSGTSPNLRITLASPKSPLDGSPVREKASRRRCLACARALRPASRRRSDRDTRPLLRPRCHHRPQRRAGRRNRSLRSSIVLLAIARRSNWPCEHPAPLGRRRIRPPRALRHLEQRAFKCSLFVLVKSSSLPRILPAQPVQLQMKPHIVGTTPSRSF